MKGLAQKRGYSMTTMGGLHQVSALYGCTFESTAGIQPGRKRGLGMIAMLDYQ